MGFRAGLIAAGIATAVLAGALFGAYRMGVAHEHARNERAALEATVAAVRVNIESWTAANAETETLRRDNQRLDGDLAHARRRLLSFNAPPAPGHVGREALVDPALRRIFLCDLGRLRGDEPASCRGGAEDGADRDAANQ